jgi:tRNA nucleotidyltransferase (CCA-adding enzyme)
MKIIATHISADFDGFAAMLGLWKLHPDAKFVFPGAKEPTLRRFLEAAQLEIPEIPVKEAREVEHLILVDTSREERLGLLAELLHRTPRPYVEIYDHHAAEQVVVAADRTHIRPWGSTTTIVVLELMEVAARQSAPILTSFEASVMLTGIYEDTTSFLSAGTTPEDFQAALYLLHNGAEITVVNRLLTHRLTPEQTAFFNEMIAHFEEIEIERNRVCLSVFSWPRFVPEAAYLVHRLMDLQPIELFFMLVQMDNRVHIIARNSLPDADVGKILLQLGGGGHSSAASAVMKGVTLIEAKEKLMAVLGQTLKRRDTAADLMKTSVISIESSRNIAEAAALLNSYRINALPVMEGGRVVGTISRQIVDGAVFAGLEKTPLPDYMLTDLPLIDPETPVEDIFRHMMEGRTRFVLVGKDASRVEGIITRMDLLRFHYEIGPRSVALRKGKTSENLRPMLRKRLPEPILRLLEECGPVAETIGCKVYLVGGMVRDLLLHRDNMDLDLVAEGDGILFAQEFRKAHECEIATHDRFGTARLMFHDGLKVDVASARTESYHAPAALPSVQGGILRQDLYRRDFTINTLAIDLTVREFGRLVDYFGGWADLHHGVVRVLHSLSFIDDPTRTLRAIRFATRFNFRISKDTHRLLQSAVEIRVLDRLTGKRLWNELRNILEEEHPIPALRLMQQYGLFQFLHPQVTLDAFLLELLYQVQSVLSWCQLNFLSEHPAQWLLYLMALVEKLDKEERMNVAQRFQLTGVAQEMLGSYKSDTKDIFSRLHDPHQKDSSLYFSLAEYPLEVLLYALARLSEEPIRRQISHFLRELRSAKLTINGDDLLRLGVPQGPKIREGLGRVMAAMLDGQAPTREAQLALAAASSDSPQSHKEHKEEKT